MRHGGKALLIAALLILVPSSTMAQVLWNETTSGMSSAEVKKIHPEAQRPTKPDTLHSGAIEKLRIPSIPLLGNNYKVSFYFLQDKLQQVTLELIKTPSAGQGLQTYEDLARALKAKYGQPIDEKPFSVQNLAAYQTNWLAGKTNINLVILLANNQLFALSIIYQTRLAEGGEKL